MPGAETTELFACTPQQFYELITDYEKYPEFLSEVKSCKLIRTEGSRKLVEFSVSLIKSFSYRMWITESPHTHTEWTLESGDIFKTSTGSWDLEEVDGKTRAHYRVDATFKVFLPGPIAKSLVSVNLPLMMKSYHQRVKEKYGR